MIPGGSVIYTCPHCGKKKSLMALLSGNTFGSTLWSDNKMDAPMLPRPSYVQYCNECGHYFTLGGLEPERSTADTFDLGNLTYEQMKEALNQMSRDGFCGDEDELNVRIRFIQSYNDAFARNEMSAPADDYALFVDNVHILLRNKRWPQEAFATALRAEYYREIGEFENARHCLDSIQECTDDFVSAYIDSVKEKINDQNSEVFQIR